MAAPRRRWTPTLLVVVAALLINLPVLHGLYLDRRLAADGVHRVAPVEAHREAGGAHLLRYALDGASFTADVEEDVFEQAVHTGEVGVRVLPDDPAPTASTAPSAAASDSWSPWPRTRRSR